MSIFLRMAGYLISLPARAKGARFGYRSYIAPGYSLFFRKLRGVNIGNRVFIDSRASLYIIDSGKITIGDGTNIGKNVTISSCNNVTIGKKCSISYNVSILDHNHDFSMIENKIIHSGVVSKGEIFIDEDCFIGAHSFILSGVKLGKHCVVGANSVVTKSFSSGSVVAGNPATLLKKIN